MSQPMTSWKEIAAYLGKSVRTVQRWEQELALPVRRPRVTDKNVVIAIREELEVWVSSQRTLPLISKEHADELRLKVASLEAENEQLRRAVATEYANFDLRCELLRDTVRSQASLGEELSLRSGVLQARSHELSKKSRNLRRTGGAGIS
jgi:hypothetical protein